MTASEASEEVTDADDTDRLPVQDAPVDDSDGALPDGDGGEEHSGASEAPANDAAAMAPALDDATSDSPELEGRQEGGPSGAEETPSEEAGAPTASPSEAPPAASGTTEPGLDVPPDVVTEPAGEEPGMEAFGLAPELVLLIID